MGKYFPKKERNTMKKTIALAVIAATAGLASADTMVIDVSGTEFFDALGDSSNTILSVLVGASASITSISWDLNLTTFTDPNASFPSWASEANIDFNGLLNLQVSGTAAGVVNENNAGTAVMADILGGPLVLGADGLLNMEFWESFDDSADNADSAMKDGSTITLNGNGFVPTPGSMAVLGLGGLVAGRRRR